MARIRSVHPDICDDETLADVSASAERTYIRLWCHLDDDGRGIDNVKLLKAHLFPLHDDVTIETIESDLSELADAGLLLRYIAGGKGFLAAVSEHWRWQKPRRHVASKHPAPPDGVGTCADIVGTRAAGGEGRGGEMETGDRRGSLRGNHSSEGPDLDSVDNPSVAKVHDMASRYSA